MKLIKWRIENLSRSFVIVALFLTVAQAGLVWKFVPDLPPQVPLFYSLPWGETRLGDPSSLWLLPAISLIILVLNFTASALADRIILTRILSTTSFLVSIFAFITLGKIILLGLP